MKFRYVAIVALLGLVLAACGQFEGVHERAVALADQGAGTGTGDTGTAIAPGTDVGTDVGAGTTTGPGTTTGGGAPTGGGTTTGPGTTTGGGGTQARQPGTGGTNQDAKARPPTGGDSTGVTASTITIGIHAPLTGAAPVKASSFDVGKDLYWEKGNNGKPILVHGRQVKVMFQDDQYNPSHARLVCQQMAEGRNAFLLVGGAGTDQIQACAQYARTRGIPYVSAGTTEVGIRKLNNYFALSMSYAQQAPLLAQYVRNVLGVKDVKKMAAVVTNTANFDDFVEALQKALPGIKVFRNDKNERGSNRASSLCTGTIKNYDVVITPNAPAYYLEMASAAKCKPQYVGPGVTNGIDQVADLGCKSDRSTENARFFMPSPSFEDASAGKWDPMFRKVAPSNADDIVWLFWGLSKTLHRMLEAVGPNLTREAFIHTVERSSFKTGAFPDLKFTPGDHFGANQVHVLRNVCRSRGSAAGYYITEAAFKSSF